MDDSLLRDYLGSPEEITRSNIEQHMRRLGMPEVTIEDTIDALQPILSRRGRPYFKNVVRDVKINIVVERLQDEGCSFRQACKQVASFVNLSPSAVVSICQKLRKRKSV